MTRTVGDGVRTNSTGAGVLRTVGAGVGGAGIVGMGVGGTGIVGDGVMRTGAGVAGGNAGIIPSEPAGAQGIPGEVSSNFTSHPIHAPGAHVNDMRATSYPVINCVLTHELYPEQVMAAMLRVDPWSFSILIVASRAEERPDIVIPAKSVTAGVVPRGILIVT